MMVGLFEPKAAPWQVEGIPRGLLVRHDPAGLGPDGAVPGEGDGPGPGDAGGRRTHVLLRPGVVHARPRARRRRGARASATTSSPPGMNSVGILSAGGLGRVLAHWITTGRPDVDVTGFNVDRFRPWQADDGLPGRAHHRDPRHRVRRAHPRQAAALGAQHAALPRPRPAGRAGRLPARGLRAGRAPTGSPGRASTPTAEPTWGRAPWFEQWEAEHRAVREGVGPDGHELHGQAPGARRRRRRRARPGLGRRGERRAGDHHLHPVARRGRPDRGRPDGHQARRRRLPRGRLRHRARARAGLAGPPRRPSSRRRRAASRTSPPTSPSSTCRGRGPARCWPRSPTADLSTEAFGFRTARVDRRWPASGCCASGSPTSASSATSSTCPPATA